MSKIFFISFSGSVEGDDDHLVTRQKLLNKSAITTGNADEEIAWTRDDLLGTEYYQQNKRILDQPRGAGFWSWKPYIILKTLDKVSVDDWVVYSDIGKPYKRGDPSRGGNFNIGNIINTPFDSLIDYAKSQNGFTPGIWVPHYGNAKMWTKRDCFVGMGCDSTRYHDASQVQAGYSCWSNSKESRAFLTQWLYWCQVEAVISDQTNIYGKPNFHEFRDHRHDQSIITNLVLKNNISLFGSKVKSLDGSRDFNLIIRHMALAKDLTTDVRNFACLFETKAPLLPPPLQQALTLWLLPELKTNSIIHIKQTDKKNSWQQAFPNCNISLGEHTKNQKFLAIFDNNCEHEKSLEEVLARSYESLIPGGILVMGPFDGVKSSAPKLNASFNELLEWIFLNQCFPSYLSTKENQKPNSLTLGNAKNPFIISLKANTNYVILRKPHMKLVS